MSNETKRVLEMVAAGRITAEEGERLLAALGAGQPAAAASGDDVHVVWADLTYGNYEIFYKRSTDAGASWSFQRLSNNAQGTSGSTSSSASASTIRRQNTLSKQLDFFTVSLRFGSFSMARFSKLMAESMLSDLG